MSPHDPRPFRTGSYAVALPTVDPVSHQPQIRGIRDIAVREPPAGEAVGGL